MAAVSSMTPNSGVGERLTDLVGFREQVYKGLTKRQDALFGVLDAVCCPVAVASLADRHDRRHGSVYAALVHARIDTDKPRDELGPARDPSWPLPFAVDTSTWPRCDAECSPERGYHPPAGTRPASRAWPAGATPRAPSRTWPPTPGPPRWIRCTRRRRGTRSRPDSSAP